MMVPAGIFLHLFVLLMVSWASSNEELVHVPEKTEQIDEGSCVTIPCSYRKPKEETYTLLWFRDAKYDGESKQFTGTIVYSNTEERPQSPNYSSRVEYITDATSQIHQNSWIKCDLRITDLQKTDSGNYSFRFIVSSNMKYISKAVILRVTENPCKVHIEPPELKNPLKESEEFTVLCSTSGSCDSHPEWLVHASGQKQEWTSSSSSDMIIETEEGEGGRQVTKLKLKTTWKDDNRILSCRPEKSEESCQIRNIALSVEYAPKKTKATVSSEDVKERDSVTLSCTSRGRPDVSFTWFKTGKKYKQMSDLTLIHVKPDDSGEYYCEAKNQHGTEKSDIIKIDVKYAPQGVTVQSLVNINDVKEGGELKLKCSVKSGNPAVYQFTWYKDDQVQKENRETLIISNVTAEDGGSYQCQADNGIKRKSSIFTVFVKYSPRNIRIDGTTSVKVGTPLTLRCSADANPQPHTYTWKHTHGLSSVPLSMETAELNIANMNIQHAGQYTCDVTNTIGTRSHTIEVIVLYPPSKPDLLMKKEVTEFEVISIICTVQSFPVSHLTVTGPLGDLRYIQNNRGNSTVSANMLTVYLNVTELDAGTYTCKAENQEGNQETKQQLTVFYVPKNVTASIKGEQTFGNELTLTCAAQAIPAPSYEWKKFFNEQLKTTEQKHKQSLHFNSLEISDSGQYVCIAQNSFGKTESPLVEIKVKYFSNINIVHNMTSLTQWNWEFPVNLNCNADAYPPATDYKWYREEDNTTVLSRHQSFTVQPQNPGIYYCTASNVIGKSRSKNIMLFIGSNSLKVFYQIILPIILLLILIVVAIFLIRRTIIKARSDQQSGADNPLCFFPVFLSRSSTVTNLLLLGSRNNTQENLSVESIPDPGYGRVNQSHPTPNSQDPTGAQQLNPRPKSNVHTVYAAIKLPQMKPKRPSPKQQKTVYVDNGADTSTLNYVTVNLKGQNEPEKRVPEGSAVYAVVSKNKQTKNSQLEHPDYENVSSACVPKLPFTNMDWESDTSEEDEVNYSTVSCSAKSAAKESKHNKKSSSSSSTSDDEDRTVYSAVKT